jgi:hypothetical protein
LPVEASDAEDKSSVADLVDGGGFLGKSQGMAERQDLDRGADLGGVDQRKGLLEGFRLARVPGFLELMEQTKFHRPSASRLSSAVTDGLQSAASLESRISRAPRIAARRCRLALSIAVKAAKARTTEVAAHDAEGIVSRYGRVQHATSGNRQQGNQDSQHCSLTSLACVKSDHYTPEDADDWDTLARSL